LRGLKQADVDCGNAGTLMRLLAGILAGSAAASR
jgi:5-enolpyruvylshikimate-3-phosphate synthase